MLRTCRMLCIVWVLCVGIQFAGAVEILWEEPVTVTSADILLIPDSSLVHAGSWGHAGFGSMTVEVGDEMIVFNGTADDELSINDGNGVNADVTCGGQNANNNYFPGTTGNDLFDTALKSFAWDGPNPKVLTLHGLIPGRGYYLQLFVSDTRGCCGARTQLWSDANEIGVGHESATFSHNQSVMVFGSFVADAETVRIYGHGVGQAQQLLNAYQLRQADLLPVAHWTFDANDVVVVDINDVNSPLIAVDVTGNGYDGPLTGQLVVDGRIGEALSFDGAAGIALVDSNALPIDNTDSTVMAWINSTSVLQMGVVAFSPADFSHNKLDRGFALNQKWGPEGTMGIDQGWVGAVNGETVVNDGEWHHVAYTQAYSVADSNDHVEEIVLYVDGVVDANAVWSNWRNDDTSQYVVSLGRGVSGSYYPDNFVGVIDDVQIYGVVLTQEEILNAAGIDVVEGSETSEHIDNEVESDDLVEPIVP